MPSRNVVMAYWRSTALGTFAPGTDTTTNQILKLLAESAPAGFPNMTLSRNQISRTVDVGGNPLSDTFEVTNTGSGTLLYRLEANQDWLGVAPSSGSSTGEADSITVSYNVAQLPIGPHQAAIQVSDNGSSPPATNCPQTVAVTVTVKSVLPDFDLDRDVDQADWGFLQACFTDVGEVASGDCQRADLDGDTQVDSNDFAVFQGCLSGPGSPPDNTCDDAYE